MDYDDFFHSDLKEKCNFKSCCYHEVNAENFSGYIEA
jgi:hypothetical protein